MRGRRKHGGLLVDLILLLTVCALYVATAGNDGSNVLARAAMAPVYRGGGEAVGVQCAVSWDAAALPDILDILKARGTCITFAVSGAWARENPALLMRMAAEGHEIATMGDDPGFDGKLSEVEADVRTSAEAIAAVTGRAPAHYYSGARNVQISGRAAKKLGLRQVLCTADLLCARGTAADIQARAWDAAIQGSILLVQPTAEFAKALDGLLTALQTKGSDVVRVGDVLGKT